MHACAECSVYVCRVGNREAGPDNCPMQTGDQTDQLPVYEDPEVREFARIASLIEAVGYGRWTRLEETMELAKRNGFTRLGLAFCAGLRSEAKVLSRVLKANGFEVVSAMCKTGAIPKEAIGIRDEEKVRPGTVEPMCNPVAQAALLNESETQLNILFGLCVGHDSLFIKHCRGWVTVLVAKDRVLAHNPIGAIYLSDGYYKKKLYEDHR
ncbi:MAG: DUF1847 domain-containing protein [Chloroflexi bacterium]|nr:DUF1847 domain-containing protein [Chloroflexota bacterium]